MKAKMDRAMIEDALAQWWREKGFKVQNVNLQKPRNSTSLVEAVVVLSPSADEEDADE